MVIKRTGDLITLPYTEEAYIAQSTLQVVQLIYNLMKQYLMLDKLHYLQTKMSGWKQKFYLR